MLQMWDGTHFQAVVVDEVSRLARDLGELAKLQARIDETKVRLLTTDGLDSANPHWRLVFGITAAIADHFREETRHRVVRGLAGQLKRGYIVNQAPYGYRLERIQGDSGALIGTRYVIEPTEAEVMRELFDMRYKGKTYA